MGVCKKRIRIAQGVILHLNCTKKEVYIHIYKDLYNLLIKIRVKNKRTNI